MKEKPTQQLSILERASGTLSDISFGISTASRAIKKRLLASSAKIKEVSSPKTLEVATNCIRSIAENLKALEAARQEIKAPVIKLGRDIDAVANEYRAELDAERDRVKALSDAYLKKEADRVAEEERLKEEEIERVAEEARKRLEKTKNEARKAEIRETAASQINSLATPLPVVAKPKGVSTREEWTFEVVNAEELYLSNAKLCNPPTPKTLEILAIIKQCDGAIELPGLRIFKKTVNRY